MFRSSAKDKFDIVSKALIKFKSESWISREIHAIGLGVSDQPGDFCISLSLTSNADASKIPPVYKFYCEVTGKEYVIPVRTKITPIAHANSMKI